MHTLVLQQHHARNQELRRRLRTLDQDLSRLQRERERLARELAKHPNKAALVTCPSCGRDHDFLIDNGGYLAHVLEDEHDTEAFEPGKPLFCTDCEAWFTP